MHQPTYHGYQGGDLIGVIEHLDYLVRPGCERDLFHADLSVGVQPPLSHARLRKGRSHAGRDARPAADDRRGPCPRYPRRLDGVFNHASRGFFQFHDIMENGPNSAYLDWFTIKEFPLNAYDSEKSPNYQAWWGLPALPKFNVACPEVREFLWGIARKWVEFGIDGWRLDVPNEIDDDAFWREFRAAGARGQSRGVHRRRGLDRLAALAARGHVGRRDELSVHAGVHRLFHRREL